MDNDLMVVYYSCIVYINTKLITASNIVVVSQLEKFKNGLSGMQ